MPTHKELRNRRLALAVEARLMRYKQIPLRTISMVLNASPDTIRKGLGEMIDLQAIAMSEAIRVNEEKLMQIQTPRVIQLAKRRQVALDALALVQRGYTMSEAAAQLKTSRTRIYKEIAVMLSEQQDDLLK